MERIIAHDDLSFSPDSPTELKHIGGADISYFPDGRAVGCIVVLEFPSLKLVFEIHSEAIDLSGQPYEANKLALR